MLRPSLFRSHLQGRLEKFTTYKSEMGLEWWQAVAWAIPQGRSLYTDLEMQVDHNRLQHRFTPGEIGSKSPFPKAGKEKREITWRNQRFKRSGDKGIC